LQRVESLQRRADILAFGEIGPDNYHLAKARTWIDLALSEYYEGENNDIIPAAAGQAEALLEALEKKQANIAMDTPVQIPGSEAVRPDLWKVIGTLKSNVQFSCGQRSVAEAEVHLVWAGHEKLESSWEHAQTYARSAEELVREAIKSIDACAASHLAKNPPPVLERITLPSDAMYEFGSGKLDHASLWRLNRLADSIKRKGGVEEVILVGHTDHLRSDGRQARNQELSEQRAESVRQYLIGRGVPADKIHARGAGSSQPIVQCPASLSKAKLVDCLQPNRRVEVILRGTRQE